MSVTIQEIRTIETAPNGINLLVVKVLTSEPGLYGLGCATLAYRTGTVRHLIDTYIAPLLIGRNATAITDIWQLIHQNSYWRSGPIENNAISGIDMALWDIKGKMAGMPLYQLLGGKVRAGVPVYRHADGNSIEELIENMEYYRSIGLKYIRCQMGIYGGTPYGTTPADAAKGAAPGTYIDSRKYMTDTVKMFDRLRSHFGEELEMVHDVHERIHPTQAREFCKALDPYHLFFMEDVVSPENIDWLREIHDYCTTPLSMGELFSSSNDWRKPIINRSLDILRCHLSDIGGITPAIRMAHFAEEFGTRTCWHCPPDLSPVGAAAIIHLDLATPACGLQEWSAIQSYQFLQQSDGKSCPDAVYEVFSGMPEYGNDGYVYIKDTPGLGVDIDEKAAARYTCSHPVTLWTQVRNKDGQLQTP